MKKELLLLAFLILYFPCHAKWEKIHENKYFVEYLEVDSVKKNNEIIYMWSMKDYKEPRKDGSLSTKYYTKYNCSERKYVIISIINYDTNMGKGRKFKYKKNLNDKLSDLDWIHLSQKSKEQARINVVCKFSNN